MKIKIKNLELLSRETEVRILRSILENRNLNLGWIRTMLRIKEIPGRTRHYLAFQDPYYFNVKNFSEQRLSEMQSTWITTTEQRVARVRAVEEILEHSELKWWVYMFMKEVPLEEVARTIAQHMNNRLEIEISLLGTQT